MMISAFCIFVILGVAYALHHEGLFTAVTMLVNVLLAGFLTFEVWEPFADMLDGAFQDGALAGLEDCLAMVMSFCLFLTVLRLTTNALAFNEVQYEPNVNRAGSIIVGLITGYLVAGFLVVCFETLPWNENFLGYTSRSEEGSEGFRKYIPPDRVWLALMRRAGSGFLSWTEVSPEAEQPWERYRTFDPYGSFELRYQRYRRYTEKEQGGEKKYIPPLPYRGEFDQDVGRKQQ